ncbi:MAG: hypothetical protein JSU96_20475, partial [Acidobacteriota bacterium]
MVKVGFKWLPGAFGLANLCGALVLFGLTFSILHLSEVHSDLEGSLQLLAESQEKASENLEALRAEAERLRLIYEIALELELSPRVVEAFNSEAERVVYADDDRRTWRFTPSAGYFTYMLCSLAATESNGKVKAVGDGGTSFGLTQMKLATAREYDPELDKEDLLELRSHARVATAHYVDLLRESNGNHGRVAIKWNRGRSVERLFAMG